MLPTCCRQPDTHCGGTYLRSGRVACAKCSGAGPFGDIKLSDHGTLYVYTIVYRSFPGVPVPYVSAIVDLDGGGTVKGNLVGIDPDPQKIQMGMPVEVVYRTAPIKDREGNEYLTYCFQPRA